MVVAVQYDSQMDVLWPVSR